MLDTEYAIKVVSDDKTDGQYFQSYHNDIFSVDGYSWGNYKQASLFLNNAKEFLSEKYPDWKFDLVLEEIETAVAHIQPNEENTENFKFSNILDNFSSDFAPDEKLYSKILNCAEKELSKTLNNCTDYEINLTHSGIHTNLKYFIQMEFDNGVIEWEYTGEI